MLISWLKITWGNIVNLFFLYQSVCQLYFHYLIFKTTYSVVAGREEESRPIIWWHMSVELLGSVVGGIYGSMVLDVIIEEGLD